LNNLKDQFLLDPEVAYLNHGAYGACPRQVFEAYQRYQCELEREPATLLYRDFTKRMQETRAGLSQFLNCESDQIAFVRNVTYGLNMVAQSLIINEGDKILATEHEYGAVDRMWETICKERGAQLIRVKMPLPLESASSIVDQLKVSIDPSVKIITFPHIAPEVAQLFPIEELTKIARDAGAVSVVDGAHAPGQIKVDLKKINADFYVGNCHKWMLSPKGAGFVYASREYENKIRPPAISWGNISEGNSSLLMENDWQGTTDISSILAVQDSIEFLNQHEWFETIIPRSAQLISEFNDKVLNVTGMDDLYVCNDLRPPQMRTYLLPEGDHSSLHTELFQHFKVDVPVFLHPEGNMFRISVQAYNNESDLDRLVAALRELL
tara:strand:- start:2013 stop:3152 length:1140 start_codon:yes stop_codon:yes gene_type:complete